MTQGTRESYHHGDLENALVEAALAVIREAGAEGMTLREVARRVGVNHRAAYRHFADKTALLAAVAERGFVRLLEAMQQAVDSKTEAIDALASLGRAYVKFAVQHPAHFRVMFGPRLNEDGRFPSLEAPIAAAFGLLTETLARGVEAGVLVDRPVRELAISVWSTVHGLASLILMRKVRVKREKLPDYVDEVLGPLLRGLRRDPA